MASRPSEASGTPPADAAAELALLRSVVRGGDDRPGLTQALPRLQRAHRKHLVRRERWTQGELARHPDARELTRSWRRPGNMDQHGRLLRVFDAQRVLSEDVHENRVVRHTIGRVRARLVAIAPREPEAAEMLRELDSAVSQAPFLRDVGPLQGRPTEPTATLSGDPLYRSVFRSLLELDP
jgi:hypothetical protein